MDHLIEAVREAMDSVRKMNVEHNLTEQEILDSALVNISAALDYVTLECLEPDDE